MVGQNRKIGTFDVKSSQEVCMQLVLRSTARPDASIETLRRAARRRDLEGLELVLGAGPADGVASRQLESKDDADGNTLEKGDPPIRRLLIRGAPSVADVLYRGRQASLIDAGLLLRGAVPESPLALPVALMHATDREAAQRAAAWARMHNAETGWEVDLGTLEKTRIDAVLEATASTLSHVRVRGAGPEVQEAPSDGPGLGTLLKALALRGYSGTIALAPSTRGKEGAWREWLFDERGWGCNTAAKKKDVREATAS